MKLFVSYRRDDWSFTYWLVEELKQLLDAEIFVDFSGINDSNFETSLLRNLHDSDAVLLIVTKNTFADRIHKDSDWVRRELRESLAQAKPIAMACHNGIFPTAHDLPDDIALIGKVQGIEFYPRYFKAGVRELAAFIDRSTPINLRQAVTIAAPVTTTAPKPDKALYDDATTLAETGQYEQALKLLTELKVRGYVPKYAMLDEIIADVTQARDVEQRRWDAGERYDEIVALLRINKDRARLAWVQFGAEYPEFQDDPAKIANIMMQVTDQLPTKVQTHSVSSLSIQPPHSDALPNISASQVEIPSSLSQPSQPSQRPQFLTAGLAILILLLVILVGQNLLNQRQQEAISPSVTNIPNLVSPTTAFIPSPTDRPPTDTPPTNVPPTRIATLKGVNGAVIQISVTCNLDGSASFQIVNVGNQSTVEGHLVVDDPIDPFSNRDIDITFDAGELTNLYLSGVANVQVAYSILGSQKVVSATGTCIPTPTPHQ